MLDRFDNRVIGLPLAWLFIALLAVLASGCGRRGDPQPLSSAAVLATDVQGSVVRQDDAPAKPDRRFILDALIQ